MPLESEPWWIGAVTGSVGALVTLAIGCYVGWNAYFSKDKELVVMTKESIEVITKILIREEQNAELNREIIEGVHNILSHIKQEDTWKQQIEKRLSELVTNIQNPRTIG